MSHHDRRENYERDNNRYHSRDDNDDRRRRDRKYENKYDDRSRGFQSRQNPEVCRFFLKGSCRFGENCRNKHPDNVQSNNNQEHHQDRYHNDRKRNYDDYQRHQDNNYHHHEDRQQKEDSSNKIQEKQYDDLQMQISRIYDDIKKINPLRLKQFENRSLDLMFIIDCTGSMDSWIKACKDEVKQILDFVMNQFQMIKIRISIVGYRDIINKQEDFEILKFCSEIDKVENFLFSLEAKAGGDIPENIAGAFEKALEQDWQAQTKYAILIADAPCHGSKYHNCNDDFPKGDIFERDVEKQIQEFAKRKIFFNAVKITKETDKMFKLFNEQYEKLMNLPIQIADLGSSTENLSFFVSSTVKNSLSMSIVKKEQKSVMNKLIFLLGEEKGELVDKIMVLVNERIQENESKVQQQQIKQLQQNEINEEELLNEINAIENQFKEKQNEEKKINIDKDEEQKCQVINLNTVQLDKSQQEMTQFKSICHTWFIVKDADMEINWKKPLIQKSQITTQVSISSKPFSKGAMRYAFYMKDLFCKQELVGKLPKEIHPKNYNLQEMSKDIEAMFICSHLVNSYNDLIIGQGDQSLMIEFVHSFIYELTESMNKDNLIPFKYYYGENFIPGKYEKYNNNAGWKTDKNSKQAYSAEAFSHFSWQITQGYLMIVDLQGVNNVLTDPQIHCLDKSRFGQGNLGYMGVLLYFNNHICNKYCNALGLINPVIVNDIPQGFSLYKDIKEPRDRNQKIQKLCDLCRQPFSLYFETYQRQRSDNKELWCDDCTRKRNNSLKEGRCSICRKTFKSSEYWFLMKKTDFPDKCSEHRLQNRKKLREELENQELEN